jgi:hypothetical protein
MRRMLLAMSVAGALVVGGGMAGTAAAKKHHKKTKVTMKGWYLITNAGTQTVSPGATAIVCNSTDKHIAFLGMSYSWKNATAGAIVKWKFSGPGLNHPENYQLPTKSGSYPGTPYGVTSGAQTRPMGTVGFLPGSYTGKISQKGKTLAKETLTLANC